MSGWIAADALEQDAGCPGKGNAPIHPEKQLAR